MKNDDDFGPYSTAEAPQVLRDIRKFLWTELAVTEMVVATKLGRPAVEPLSDHLEKKFGASVHKDGVKKFIGWETRKVMEHHGHPLDRKNCLVRFGGVFSRAARYHFIKPGK